MMKKISLKYNERLLHKIKKNTDYFSITPFPLLTLFDNRKTVNFSLHEADEQKTMPNQIVSIAIISRSGFFSSKLSHNYLTILQLMNAKGLTAIYFFLNSSFSNFKSLQLFQLDNIYEPSLYSCNFKFVNTEGPCLMWLLVLGQIRNSQNSHQLSTQLMRFLG